MSAQDDHVVLRPRPRRPFSLTNTPEQSYPSRPDSPAEYEQSTSPAHLGPGQQDDLQSPPSRTRSVLNLTSSTLFGIYGSSADKEDGSTPFGTGAETPTSARSRHNSQPEGRGLGIDAAAWQEKSRRRRSSMLDKSARRTVQRARGHSQAPKRRGFKSFWLPHARRSTALAAVGVCYGLLISQLHERREIAPVPVEGIPHHSRAYLASWGLIAVFLGQLMPQLDRFWERNEEDSGIEETEMSGHLHKTADKSSESRRGSWAPEWNDVVRSIGAFVGIAFAIRKLPWQSTLQLSLTLALSNPAIWYLLDRTPPGLVFSTTVALSGTALCLAINPDVIPTPSSHPRTASPTAAAAGSDYPGDELVAGMFSQESVGVATWIASVLFVSAVCFGNIGRRL